MAPREIDEVEERIAELQCALDELETTLGRIHETIDLIGPPEADDGGDAGDAGREPDIDLDAGTRTTSDVIDLRGISNEHGL